MGDTIDPSMSGGLYSTKTTTSSVYTPFGAGVRNAYGSDLMTRDLENEQTTLQSRNKICQDLSRSEADQAAAASNLVAAQQSSCQANQRASDCDRPACQEIRGRACTMHC